MENYFLAFDELPTKFYIRNKKGNALKEVRLETILNGLELMSPFHNDDLLKKGSTI